MDNNPPENSNRQKVLTSITDIPEPKHQPIPGDYKYSSASEINDFIMRLKYSLSNATEMLSNTTAFWIAGELQNKKLGLYSN